MDATKPDDLPELLGRTPAQVHYAARIRRSMLAIAKHKGDHETLSLIRSTVDATKYLAADSKRRPLSAFVRNSGHMDTPAVAELRAKLSAPWWSSRKAAMDGAIGRLEPPW